MYDEKGGSEQVDIKLPHWLKGDNYKERERKSIYRRYLILRVLAIHGHLSIYGVMKKIETDHKLSIAYPRVRGYLSYLDRKKLIFRLKGRQLPRKTKRNEKFYALSGGVIGHLYFQHFLTMSEVIDIMRCRSAIVMFDHLFQPKEIEEVVKEVVETQLSAEIIAFESLSHTPERVYDLTPNYMESVSTHMQETRVRDINTQIVSNVLHRLARRHDLRDAFIRSVESHPELMQLIDVLRPLYHEFRSTMQSELDELDEIEDLLADVPKGQEGP